MSNQFNFQQQPQINKFDYPFSPSDTISSLSWAPNSSIFCATSWNCEAYIMSLSDNRSPLKLTINHKGPIFTSSFLNNNTVITAGADNLIMRTDLGQNKNDKVGMVGIFIHFSFNNYYFNINVTIAFLI